MSSHQAVEAGEMVENEVGAALLYIEEACARAGQAVRALQFRRADPRLIAALERSEHQLTRVVRELREGSGSRGADALGA